LSVKECGVADQLTAPAAVKPVKVRGSRKRGSVWNQHFDLKKGPKVWQAAQVSGYPGEPIAG
jgi:hypothetical protein